MIKRKKYKKAACAAVCVFLAGCSCNPPLRITPIQRADKRLTCKSLVLEINEAEHYRMHALGAIKDNAAKLYAPYCVVNGLMVGSDAVKAADRRIQYLGHIYDLLNCGNTVLYGQPEPSQEKAPE